MESRSQTEQYTCTSDDKLINQARSALKHLYNVSDAIDKDLPVLDELLARSNPPPSARPGQYADRPTQTTESGESERYRLHQRPQPKAFQFRFLPLTINWPSVRAINVSEVVRNGDASQAMARFDDLAFLDMEKQDMYNLTEGNLVQMIKVLQLMLQFVTHERDLKHHKLQALREKEVVLDRFIQGMASMSMDSLPSDVARMRSQFQQLEAHDLDAMLIKARLEGAQSKEAGPTREQAGISAEQV